MYLGLFLLLTLRGPRGLLGVRALRPSSTLAKSSKYRDLSSSLLGRITLHSWIWVAKLVGKWIRDRFLPPPVIRTLPYLTTDLEQGYKYKVVIWNNHQTLRHHQPTFQTIWTWSLSKWTPVWIQLKINFFFLHIWLWLNRGHTGGTMRWEDLIPVN